ncbi:MAG: hypothetical protein GWO20_17000, partial [Candidatus Korarchaeota archaeon]|nr:hypothetical protein [Candidatus Korarchaeota archaeon]NIU85423.1 hypothetical protein [Candidatus Thorarchaeota archaeon]NIW15520.1 hypothetical protein [Candidatus Thorarchaeota archaeon]NIW53465.1 hypothetical protein [Candidatus Korarchaeota archaeon]
YDVWVVSTPEGQSDYAYLIKDPEFGDRLLLKEDDVRSYEDYQDLIAELKEAPSMNEELAEDILDEFENTRGFNLAIKKRYGNLYLYDEGGVNEDISEDSPNRLRKRIREWISNA